MRLLVAGRLLQAVLTQEEDQLIGMMTSLTVTPSLWLGVGWMWTIRPTTAVVRRWYHRWVPIPEAAVAGQSRPQLHSTLVAGCLLQACLSLEEDMWTVLTAKLIAMNPSLRVSPSRWLGVGWTSPILSAIAVVRWLHRREVLSREAVVAGQSRSQPHSTPVAGCLLRALDVG